MSEIILSDDGPGDDGFYPSDENRRKLSALANELSDETLAAHGVEREPESPITAGAAGEGKP